MDVLRRLHAMSGTSRVAIVLLLLGSCVAAGFAVHALRNFSEVKSDGRVDAAAAAFWALFAAWPLLSAALVIYRRHSHPPRGRRVGILWWIAMALLPWSWLTLGLLPPSLVLGSPALRYLSGWPGHLASALAAVFAAGLWLWVTRNPARRSQAS